MKQTNAKKPNHANAMLVRRSVFAYPYVVWMAVFILSPMLLILYYAFTSEGGATLENIVQAANWDNMRVLLWILDRCEGKVSARESEIGYLPYVKDIDIEGLENDGKEFTHMMLDELLTVDKELWREDAENIESFYASIGDRLPAKLREELETLKKNLQ